MEQKKTKVNNRHINSNGKDYYLWSKTVELKGNRIQDIYFFTADDFSSGGIPVDINKLDMLNKEIIESAKTNIPFLKSKIIDMKEITEDEYYRLTERLREIEIELAMGDAGWGPYLEDIRKEKLEIVKKLNKTPWKKQ